MEQKININSGQNVKIIQAGRDGHYYEAERQKDEKRKTEKPELRSAHVLFMDIVGFSKLKTDEQANILKALNQIVKESLPDEEMLKLPTGDGMAIAFLKNPVSPLLTAGRIALRVKKTGIPLRMGMHTGPVYLVEDINLQQNIVGGRINLTQRVMDCGDAGHILASKVVADALSDVKIEYERLFHYS